MDTRALVLIFFGFLGLAILIVWAVKRASVPLLDPAELKLIHQRLELLNQEFKSSLSESARQQLSVSHNMTGVVRDVTDRLSKIEETNRQVLSFSSQLEQLQRILSNPKQRGLLGEYYLETLLKNVLAPDQYQMQYAFQDGEIVDAVVFVKEKIICIDSKFSLENYNRAVAAEIAEDRERFENAFLNDLKTRIKETSKYVRANEGTMDFAFMFIPHEALYYDLLINKVGTLKEDTESILQKAASHYHVIIVSPTSFYAYLQTVLQGLKALHIEEQAQEIRKRVTDLGKHLQTYEQHFQNVGKHLGTVVNQYNLASKTYTMIDKDVLRITGEGIGSQPLAAIERPREEGDRQI